MAINIQLRRGTAAQWTAANPTLMEGELGVETDTAKYKIGNGSTAWNSLSYGGLVGELTLANLPASPTSGYALIYNGSSLVWGQAGSPSDDASAILGSQIFS
jgi:hypothetical protein